MAAELAAAPALDGAPLLLGKNDNTSLTKSLLAHVWAKPDRGWLLSFMIALSLMEESKCGSRALC